MHYVLKWSNNFRQLYSSHNEIYLFYFICSLDLRWRRLFTKSERKNVLLDLTENLTAFQQEKKKQALVRHHWKSKHGWKTSILSFLSYKIRYTNRTGFKKSLSLKIHCISQCVQPRKMKKWKKSRKNKQIIFAGWYNLVKITL